jgi:50S ribosomal protein L16 3-hydroxylase
MTRKGRPLQGRRRSEEAGFPGPMTTARFLRGYWQKRPLVVRGAFPGFVDPLSVREVLSLARSADAESRIVQRAGRHWSVEHGPFSRAQLQRRPASDWTVLVQDTNHFSARADALLSRFAFVPHARVDDLMVSYAVPGGTVGPHVDSYDVFLIQGSGRRRWQVSRQEDLSFVPGLDLKILAQFKPEEEWILEPGDMLYLPPDVAHYGIAETDCLTWSVGFRAPSNAELAAGFLDHLAEKLAIEGSYGDPGLAPTRHAGEIPPRLLAHVAKTLQRIRWSTRDATEFAGRFLSEPKAHVVFKPPARLVSAARFESSARRRGLALDRRTRLLYTRGAFFLNGEMVAAPAVCAPWLRTLADARRLDPAADAPAALLTLFHDWHCRGVLRFGDDEESP